MGDDLDTFDENFLDLILSPQESGETQYQDTSIYQQPQDFINNQQSYHPLNYQQPQDPTNYQQSYKDSINYQQPQDPTNYQQSYKDSINYQQSYQDSTNNQQSYKDSINYQQFYQDSTNHQQTVCSLDCIKDFIKLCFKLEFFYPTENDPIEPKDLPSSDKKMIVYYKLSLQPPKTNISHFKSCPFEGSTFEYREEDLVEKLFSNISSINLVIKFFGEKEENNVLNEKKILLNQIMINKKRTLWVSGNTKSICKGIENSFLEHRWNGKLTFSIPNNKILKEINSNEIGKFKKIQTVLNRELIAYLERSETNNQSIFEIYKSYLRFNSFNILTTSISTSSTTSINNELYGRFQSISMHSKKIKSEEKIKNVILPPNLIENDLLSLIQLNIESLKPGEKLSIFYKNFLLVSMKIYSTFDELRRSMRDSWIKIIEEEGDNFLEKEEVLVNLIRYRDLIEPIDETIFQQNKFYIDSNSYWSGNNRPTTHESCDRIINKLKKKGVNWLKSESKREKVQSLREKYQDLKRSGTSMEMFEREEDNFKKLMENVD